MTQIGIEFQKMLNQKNAWDETARANRANESIKWAGLSEDRRYHDLQRQTSLDTAAMNQATSKYVADTNFASNKYATDTGLQKGTLLGAYNSQEGWLPGLINAVGYLWDTII